MTTSWKFSSFASIVDGKNQIMFVHTKETYG